MISNNYIPEKINDFNTYLGGEKLIGGGASLDLPEMKMKSSTVSGAGVLGEIDSPTIGQFESMEQVIQFRTLYSSAGNIMRVGNNVDLTHRAAQQVRDKNGGYAFKGLRVVERGTVKSFKPGKLEKGEMMDAEVAIELSYIKIEVDGEVLVELDKLGGKYDVCGEDQLAAVSSLI